MCNQQKENNIPELLAPAGGLAQLKAAVECGADAVYLGGRDFNARMGAANFSDEELREGIAYAHLRNVKVYITMNTLLYDEELPAALAAAEKMQAMGADAFIIQDLGLGRLLRKHLPEAHLHLSTQATIYNPEGVKTAAALGYERVVPARELSLEEIRELCEAGKGRRRPEQIVDAKDVQIKREVRAEHDIEKEDEKRDVDIEVFVHGALCMCYSGRCQMSRAIGGRSANRGACAQPCRLLYTDEKGRTAHFLSPKDLCLLDRLGDLTEAGATSFKIEGRMKSPEYVAIVVSLYRKYLDLYLARRRKGIVDAARYQVDPADREKLLSVFNREGFTTAYVDDSEADNTAEGEVDGIMALHVAKHSGVPVGEVLCRQDSNIIEVKPTKPIAMGDVLEIRSTNPEKVFSSTVTYLEPKKQADGIMESVPGRKKISVGDFKREVTAGDGVYRMRSARLVQETEQLMRENTKKVMVDMVFTASEGEAPRLFVREGDFTATAVGETPCERAQNNPTTRARAKEQLCKTGGTPFAVDSFQATMEEDLFLPAAILNALRREALEKLAAQKTAIPQSPMGQTTIKEQQGAESLGLGERLIDIQSFLPEETQFFSAVTKGREDAQLAAILEKAKEEGTSALLLNNLGWMKTMIEASVKVYAGRGLNVTNGQAKMALEELGATVAELSDELLAADDPRLDLMVTEYPLLAKELTDRKGVIYTVAKDEKSRRHIIKRK